MNILIFSPGYPTDKKSDYPFVKQLVDEWVRQGNNCTVIAPFSITRNRGFCKFKTVEDFSCGGRLTILRPNVPTFSNLRIWGWSLSKMFVKLGVKYAFRFIKERQDVSYCHFWQSGYMGYLYTKKHDTPLIVATGESDIKKLLRDTDLTFLDSVKGVVSVSTKNKEESIALGLIETNKCEVFPNAVNPKVFYMRSKEECRDKIGVPQDAFIIAFVGAYKDNKGADRLSEAIRRIKGKKVYSFFIGSGPIPPTAPNMLYNGRLKHDDIPLYLNAADIFVLPTLAEGCCNAIIEAMACGLPIISSNLPFNWDVLNEDNSILIDPYDIDGIKKAIVGLRDDKDKRMKMSQAALKSAQKLTIDNRAKAILSYIKETINYKN